MNTVDKMGGVLNASVLHFPPLLIRSFLSQKNPYYLNGSECISNESILLASNQAVRESDLVVSHYLLQ